MPDTETHTVSHSKAQTHITSGARTDTHTHTFNMDLMTLVRSPAPEGLTVYPTKDQIIHTGTRSPAPHTQGPNIEGQTTPITSSCLHNTQTPSGILCLSPPQDVNS